MQLSQVPLEGKSLSRTTFGVPPKKGLYRKLCFFFKIYKNKDPKYLFDLTPQCNCQYRTKNMHNIPDPISKMHVFHQA